MLRSAHKWPYALLLLGFLFTDAPANAEGLEPCRPHGPFLNIVMTGEWDVRIRSLVFEELRSALRVRNIDVCAANDANPAPLGELRLERNTADSVEVVVVDHATQRDVRRDVDLSGFEGNAQSLALAIAADELVRASWEELTRREEPEPEATEPEGASEGAERTDDGGEHAETESRGDAEESNAEEEPTAPREEDDTERWLSLAATTDVYSGGEVQFGGLLYFEQWVHDRVGLRFGAGARLGLRREGTFGSVVGRVALGSVDLVVRLTQPSTFQLSLFGGAQVGWVGFAATPSGTGVASDEAHAFAGVRAGASARLVFSSVHIALELGAGAPIVGPTAKDGESRLSGMNGVHLFATVGFGVRL